MSLQSSSFSLKYCLLFVWPWCHNDFLFHLWMKCSQLHSLSGQVVCHMLLLIVWTVFVICNKPLYPLQWYVICDPSLPFSNSIHDGITHTYDTTWNKEDEEDFPQCKHHFCTSFYNTGSGYFEVDEPCFLSCREQPVNKTDDETPGRQACLAWQTDLERREHISSTRWQSGMILLEDEPNR